MFTCQVTKGPYANKYWSCVYVTSHCRGRAILRPDGQLITRGEHNHPARFDKDVWPNMCI